MNLPQAFKARNSEYSDYDTVITSSEISIYQGRAKQALHVDVFSYVCNPLLTPEMGCENADMGHCAKVSHVQVLLHPCTGKPSKFRLTPVNDFMSLYLYTDSCI